ncbi:hypothetical protein C8J56DRAFT_788541, partial [Mycena floridula]
FAPKIYQYMKVMLQSLLMRHTGLIQNLKNSIFPTCTVNFGPSTECFEHTVKGNGAGLWCLITAVSNHNPHCSGHIVLYSFKILVEFPSGSSIAIPSASVPHGNTPIQPGEERYSVTQYCPSGLLRWVHYGFQTAKSLVAQEGGRAKQKKLDGPPGSRWRWAISLFSTIKSLSTDRLAVFSSAAVSAQ